MISLGYAERSADGIGLQVEEDPKSSRLDGILMSRLDVDVQVLDIPSVSEKEVEGLIRYRLRSIYPGTPTETVFDFRLSRNGSLRRAVVFISKNQTIEKYRAAAGQKPLTLPYSLIEPMGKARKDVRIWFIRRDWAELSVFRGGCLVSTYVRQRNVEAVFDLPGAEGAFTSEIRGLPLIIIASPEDIAGMRGLSECLVSDASLYSLPAILKNTRKVDGLFLSRKRKPFLTPTVRLGALAAVVTVLGVLLFYKVIVLNEKRYEDARALFTSLEKESARIIGLQKEAEELAAELVGMKAQKPQDMYRFLSELSDVLGRGVRIQSLEIQDGEFRIDAVGGNPLKLMEGFKNNGSFGGVKLSQVVPDAQSGKERFSLTGGFIAH